MEPNFKATLNQRDIVALEHLFNLGTPQLASSTLVVAITPLPDSICLQKAGYRLQVTRNRGVELTYLGQLAGCFFPVTKSGHDHLQVVMLASQLADLTRINYIDPSDDQAWEDLYDQTAALCERGWKVAE